MWAEVKELPINVLLSGRDKKWWSDAKGRFWACQQAMPPFASACAIRMTKRTCAWLVPDKAGSRVPCCTGVKTKYPKLKIEAGELRKLDLLDPAACLSGGFVLVCRKASHTPKKFSDAARTQQKNVGLFILVVWS